jgi:hypothetical protein
VARIRLDGDWRSAGVMSSLYFTSEIEASAFQFPTVDRVEVYIGDKIFN